jgi:ketopantoate reductase
LNHTLKPALFQANELKHAKMNQVNKTVTLVAFCRNNRELQSAERAMVRAREMRELCRFASFHGFGATIASISASTTIQSQCLHCFQAFMWVLGSWRDRIFTASARAHAGLPMWD